MNEEQKVVPETAPKMEVIAQIAQTLKERRAARSLTLEKVTQNIKIRKQYLQAMENGAWNELPGEVYVRGFVKRYAQYLGLDGEKLMAPYLKVSNSHPPETVGASSTHNSDSGRIQWTWVVLAGIFLIGFIKVIKQERSVPVKPVPQVKTQAPQPAAKTEAAAKPGEKTVPLIPHEIAVFSPFPLWLRVTAAEKSFEGFVPQNSTWVWRGEGEFSIRLGHTKEVRIQFDGQEVLLTEDQKTVTLPL